MILDFESEEALSKEYIMCGWIWEERYVLKKVVEFRGISLHASFLEREKVSFNVNKGLTNLDEDGVPEFFYHSCSPFEIILKSDFYDFCKSINNSQGVFISKNIIASTYNALQDFNELELKVKHLISGIFILDQKALEERIIEDTLNWNKRFKY